MMKRDFAISRAIALWAPTRGAPTAPRLPDVGAALVAARGSNQKLHRTATMNKRGNFSNTLPSTRGL